MGFAKERYHMEKRSVKEWVIRAILLMIGLTITHLGMTIVIKSDAGTGPNDLMRDLSAKPYQDLFRFKRDKNLCF